MARVFGRPGFIVDMPAPKKPDEEQVLAIGVLNKGMVSSVDPADLDDATLSICKNARVRFDKTSRRLGKSTYGPTKPDSLKVRKIIEYRFGESTYYTIRVTNTGVHYSDGTSAWAAVSGTLSGGDQNVVSAAIVLDTLILANGVNRLQKVDLSAGLSDLGAIAPIARFVTGFADRVVAADLRNIYWSGNRNIDEFDAAIDTSAGQTPIDISPTDRVDYITGVFGLSTVMVIPREKSIWLATRQPIASNPFNFYSAVPKIGFDVPGSIALSDSGIIGLSIHAGNIFEYTPGSQPIPIGDRIITELLDNLTDSTSIFSDYDRRNQDYIIGVPASGTVKLWIFNKRANAWSYDEQANLTALTVTSLASDYTSIDELAGTIDAQTGTIDELSDSPIITPTLLTGDSAGNLLKEDSTVVQDGGVAFTTELRSKEYRSPKVDLLINEIRLEYEATTAGQITLEYTKDNGTTWTLAKTITTVTGAKKLIQFKKLIKARRLMWRITATNGAFDVIDYEITVYSDGESVAS